MPGERCAERHARCCNLVFGLHRANAKVLGLGELVQNVGSRGDWVAAQKHGQLRELSGGNESPCEGHVASDVGVLPRWHMRRLDLKRVIEQLSGFTEVVAGVERCSV